MFEVITISFAFFFGLAVRQIGLPPLVGFLAAGFAINVFAPRVGLPSYSGEALEHIAAYTVAVDFCARDLNKAPEQFYKLDWVAGKAQDSCCPLGPRLVPAARTRQSTS